MILLFCVMSIGRVAPQTPNVSFNVYWYNFVKDKDVIRIDDIKITRVLSGREERALVQKILRAPKRSYLYINQTEWSARRFFRSREMPSALRPQRLQ